MNSYQTTGHRDGESVSQLIRGIFHDARALSIKEFTAAKLEIREEIVKAVLSSLSLCFGAFLAALGIGFLSVMAALLLARYADLPMWVALAVIGGIYLVIGLIVIWVSQNRMKTVEPVPRESLQSAKQDVHYIGEKAAGR